MGFKNVFLAECKQLFTTPKYLFYVVVFPMLLFALMSAIFYNGVPRDLPVAYIDYDQSKLSSKLVRMLDASPVIAMAHIVTDEIEAKKLMQKGEIYAFCIIPKGFGKNVYQGLSSSAICYTNNQYLVPAGLIRSNYQKIVGTLSAGIKISREIQSKVQTDRALVEVQPILTDTHILYNPYVNYGFYLLTPVLPMFLQMVVMMVTVFVIGIEFKYGRAEDWYLLSGTSATAALWGKLLPYTFCLFFVGWWMNYLLFDLIGVPLKIPMINIVLVTFLLIMTYQFLAVAIVSITKDFRGALTIGSGYTAVALSFSAYTFPIEGFPKSIQYFSKIFPFTHYMEYLVKRGIKGIPITYSWQSVAYIFAFIIVFVLAFPKFAQKLKSGGYEKK